MSGPRQEHFRMFALYNRWANDQIYQAAAGLTPAQLNEDRGAFFKSVLGTLNHLVVTDRLWMSRLEGASPTIYRLDEMPYRDFEALREARRVENARIIAHVFGLDEETLALPFDYATSGGTPQRQPLHQILAHVFNHQTHHRGQAHDLIGQIAGTDKAPSLDMVMYQRTAMKDDAP